MAQIQIDLRTCTEGDTLISSLGAVLKYLGPTEEGDYYDHIVKYTDPLMGYGSRTHDGHVMRHNRIAAIDHDIVKIIKK